MPSPTPKNTRPKSLRRRGARLALTGVITYVLVCVIMIFLENSLIFHPNRAGNWTPSHPDVVDAWMDAADGTRIHGWLFDHPDPQVLILYAHGNAGNLTHRAHAMARLRAELNAAVLIFDYRGYGQSEGSPDETGILADARAARAWLAQHHGVVESDIVLIGRSLGSGVVVDLAKDGAKALVLESAFTSLPDTAAMHYPWLPVRWLMRTRLDSAAKIAAYSGPLLMSHGDADSVVPFQLGQRLFELAPSGDKKFVRIAQADHNDPQSEEYWRALRELASRVGGPREQPKEQE